MKHREPLLKHCETSRNTRTLAIQCDNIGARRGEIGARREDIGTRGGYVGARGGDIDARRGDIGTRAAISARSYRQYRRLRSWYNSADV